MISLLALIIQHQIIVVAVVVVVIIALTVIGSDEWVKVNEIVAVVVD